MPTYPWDTDAIPEGVHSLYAKGWDSCSNLQTSDTKYVTVDRTNPTCAITSPAEHAIVFGCSLVPITATAVDHVTQVRFYRDADVFLDSDGTSPFAIDWDSTTVADGNHTLYATAEDCLGHSATSAQRNITVKNYWYVGAQKGIANLTGAQAKIECRDLTLCNEADADPAAHSVAHVSVNRGEGGNHAWAEMGWLKGNHFWGAAPLVRRRAFFWMHASDGGDEKWFSAIDPDNNGENNYKLVMTDVANGEWSFYFDGNYWNSKSLSGWEGNKGEYVSWDGEIYTKETDMPGTLGDKCTFQNCKYDVNENNTWPDAGLTDPDMHSDDAASFGYTRVSGTQFDIWDKNPL